MTIKDIQGDILLVRVTPRASSNRIQIVDNPVGTQLIRVYITAVREKGKANEAVMNLLAKEFHIPKSSLTITSGLTGRNKKIKLERH